MKKLLAICSITLVLPAFFLFIQISNVSALSLAVETGHGENIEEPNLIRTEPIPSPTQTEEPEPVADSSSSVAATSLGPNLVPNPSLETAGSGGVPAQWFKGGYGSNTRTLTYPVQGTGGAGTDAVGLSVSGYTSGDAKWYPTEIPITGGRTYQFSDAYKSNTTSIVTIRFKHSNGSFSYDDIATLPASASFTTGSAQFTAPTSAISLTIFHLLNRNGTLTTDDYSLREVTSSTPPPSTNYVPNGSFETAGSGGNPASWLRGGWGSNTRTFTYPAPGHTGSGARVTLANYASGDAKWYTNIINLPSGHYEYTDSYTANIPSLLTIEFRRTDGTSYYVDLKTLPASSAWTGSSAFFTVPTGVSGVRVFHLIKQAGSLTLDNVSITKTTESTQGIFSTGAVTFRFDDNTDSQYTTAAPILDQAGFDGTFYVTSRRMEENGFPGYMTRAQVQSLANRGHEIGSHTRTHAHLTQLSASQQQSEIAGARQDLLSWNVGPILSFAYPFGEYNASTIQMVRDAGYTSAAATISGFVTPNSDHYQLEYQEMRNNVTLAQVKQWVDTAASTKSWLILSLHKVETPASELYTITPQMFQDIVNYVKQKGIPVVTVSEGMQSM